MKPFFKTTLQALRVFTALTLLTGLAYPLLVTLASQALFRDQANGGLIQRGGRTVGARLIEQKFTSARYFWGRPSAVDFALPSGGSNLGPTSAALKKAAAERAAAFNGVGSDGKPKPAPPQELIYASGSGLDPDLSPDAAYFQIPRVAKARGLDADRVRALIQGRIVGPALGFIGEPTVNVLELNLALDELKSEDAPR